MDKNQTLNFKIGGKQKRKKKEKKRKKEKKKKRMLFLVATTSLPAVYRPNDACWNAARSCQYDFTWK